jgi:hypothetical protein
MEKRINGEKGSLAEKTGKGVNKTDKGRKRRLGRVPLLDKPAVAPDAAEADNVSEHNRGQPPSLHVHGL